MTDTIANVPLQNDIWVDLYDATGITVGDKVFISNIGSAPVRLVVKATEPTLLDGYESLSGGDIASNESGDSGLWAISDSIDGILNVRVA